MKKLLSFLAVTVAMVATMSGNALAYFDDMNLIRVVYEKVGTREVATDLGNVKDIIAGARTGTKVYGGGADAFTNFIGTDFANLNVGYFAIDKTAGQDLWLSGGAALTLNSGKWLTIRSNVGSVQTFYKNAPVVGTSTVVVAKDGSGSYFRKLDMNNLAGSGLLSGFLMDGSNMEVNLAALASTGFLQQNLFFFDTFVAPAGSIKIAGENVWEHLKIQTLADGSTVVTPIPGALVLFGSGLLGLVGIRRKAA